MKNKFAVIIFVLVLFLCGLIAGGLWVILSRKPEAGSSPGVSNASQESYTLREVEAHNIPEDCWTVINGKVYDLTEFINRHPGGLEITRACGIDASSLFNDRQTSGGQSVGSGMPHSSNAVEQLEALQIGVLE